MQTKNPAYDSTFISRLYVWHNGTVRGERWLRAEEQVLTNPNPGYAQMILAERTRDVTEAEYEQAVREADELQQALWEEAMGV